MATQFLVSSAILEKAKLMPVAAKFSLMNSPKAPPSKPVAVTDHRVDAKLG